MKTYKVNEIFHSLQGEGYYTGTATVFVRFSGCNLRCDFCDTDFDDGTLMTADEIVAEVMQYPKAPMLVLTGGEPTLSVDDELVATLKQQTGKLIAIETNGTRPLPAGIDWVTLSPKTGFSGAEAHPCILNKCDELKVVFLRQDLSRYDHIEAKHRYLQPCYFPNSMLARHNITDCIETVLRHPEWRISIQVHRILGIK